MSNRPRLRLGSSGGRRAVRLALCGLMACGLPLHAQTTGVSGLPPLGGAQPISAPPAEDAGEGWRLPALGEAQAWTLGREQRLGDALLADLYRDQAVLEDAVFQDYVQTIWTPLFASAQGLGVLNPVLAQRFRWRLLTIRDASVNAFAMPGGVVGVHLGLMAVTDTPSQLAAVLAHELSHVAQRHLARLMERQSQVAPLAMGAAVLAMMAMGSGSGGGDAAQAVFVGSQAALAQSGINFTRDMEHEADRIGQQVFDAAGFPSAEFGAMFNKLYEASRLNDDGSFAYLRTHPLNHERLAEVMAREQSRATPAKVGSPVPEAYARWMRARAQVAQTTRREDWQDWLRASPDAAATPDAQAYRAMRAAWALGDYAQAWARLNHLAQRADLPAVLRSVLLADRVQLAFLSPVSLAPEAEVRADVAQALRGGVRAEWLTGAEAALPWPQLHASAVARLQPWLVNHPDDAQAWSVLSRLREKQGQHLRALRASAEAEAARGHWDGALDRLQAAQDWSRAHPHEDPVEAQVIWTRERQMREQQRRLIEAMRADD